jgi:hypothetical protein
LTYLQLAGFYCLNPAFVVLAICVWLSSCPHHAQVVNGRLAMAAITLSLALTVDPTLKALVAMYKASKAAVAG